MNENIIPFDFRSNSQRSNIKRHDSAALWFTGLSGSGKSTLAQAVEQRLLEGGVHTYALDGDNIRYGLNRDLGFTAEDRHENIRRIGEVSRLFVDAGLVTLVSFITPYRKTREFARQLFPEGKFVEIYVKCSLEKCESRDVKGLYKKARAGLIKNFTGIDDPYEPPTNPEIVADTENLSLTECADQVIQYLQTQNLVAKPRLQAI